MHCMLGFVVSERFPHIPQHLRCKYPILPARGAGGKEGQGRRVRTKLALVEGVKKKRVMGDRVIGQGNVVFIHLEINAPKDTLQSF